MELIDKIKVLCEETGISLHKLEIELGFGNGYFTNLGDPRCSYIKKIADYFGISLNDLLDERENKLPIEDILLHALISKDAELIKAIKKYYTLNNREKRYIIEAIELLSSKHCTHTNTRKEENVKELNPDELYLLIDKYAGDSKMTRKTINILRRNGYNTVEKLLSLNGDSDRIKRMRNCGEMSSKIIVNVIRELIEREEAHEGNHSI